jgi:hypothetical protein
MPMGLPRAAVMREAPVTDEIYSEPDSTGRALDEGRLPPRSVAWHLKRAEPAP